MTISTTTARIDYVGDGVTTLFAVPFRFFAAADLLVFALDPVTGEEVLLTLGSHYTVAGAGAPSGGTVTMLIPVQPAIRLSIQRDVQRTQSTDYVDYDPFPAESHEMALDRLTAIAQDLAALLARTIRERRAEPTTGLELPPRVTRANSLLGFDAVGDLKVIEFDEDGIGGPPGPEGPPGPSVPPGTVASWAGATPPPGWVFCNGQQLSRVTYARLFAAIGTTYGPGNGSTTFNVPDLRARMVLHRDGMGAGNTERVTSGVSGIDATALNGFGGNQALQQHLHAIVDPTHGHLAGAAGLHLHTYQVPKYWKPIDYHSDSSPPGSTFAYMEAKFTPDEPGPGLYEWNAELVDAETKNTNQAGTHDHFVGAAATGITGTQQTGGGASQNMPPVLVLNAIIATGTAPPGYDVPPHTHYIVDLLDLPIRPTVFLSGTGTDGEECLRLLLPACEFPADAAGSSAVARVPAAAETIYTIEKNGVQFGTITWDAAATRGVVAYDAATAFDGENDILTITGPDTADVDLADIGIILFAILDRAQPEME